MVPLHPQPCSGRPDSLRWITPTGVLPFTGPVAVAPLPLAALLTDGTLAAVTVEPSAVVTRLGDGHDWGTDGPRIRTALHAALDTPDSWGGAAEGDAPLDDAALYAVARELVDGSVGQFARSHGGHIELVGARDGVVTVRLTGACHGCPAAHLTVHHRLESRLRSRYPGLRAVALDRSR